VWREIVARFYTVQGEHMKQDVTACAFVIASNFWGYISAENWQNWMTL